MVHTAIQLWTLRNVDEPLPETIARVGEAGYDGVELAGLDGHEPATIRDALDDAGLDVAGAHVGMDELADGERTETVATYRELGCEHLIVPHLGAEQFATRAAVEATADDLDALATTLAADDIAFSYHNHDHEFVDIGGETAFDVLAAETTAVGFELDIAWVLAGGQDPVAYVERLADRIDLLHVTDHHLDSGDHAEVGDGDVDVPGCIDAATGAEWLVYEHDEPDDPLASMHHGAEYLAQYR
jgi:sugar phosphate isomerase/epimerase